MPLLEYENQIFLDCFHEDGLLIMSEGLGIQRILLNLLKVYCDASNLVLILNTTHLEEDHLIERLEADGVRPAPKIITNEYQAAERNRVYLEGGVLFITSRILVVDFLTDNIPAQHISGIIVCRAHKIIESCQEAFILRLYRQKNKNGFIKAFSESPSSFTSGFAHVEKVMKNLFVRKLFLWPRFHASVAECLDRHKVEVIEMHIQMSSAMSSCQTALLDLINACIMELKRCTSALDLEEVSVENTIGRSFDLIVRQQLDPIWHQLNSKTKQLVSDLKTLRTIACHLTQYDCVTFYSLVNSIRSSEKAFSSNSGWLFLDSADSLIVNSRLRLYKVHEKTVKKLSTKSEQKNKSDDVLPCLEEPPKWTALSEILAEIKEENSKPDPEFGTGRVLIVAEDDRTCNQLKEFLCEGAQNVLASLFNKHLVAKGEKYIEIEPLKKKKRKSVKKDEKKDSGSTELTLTQMGSVEASNSKQQTDEGDNFKCSSEDAYYGILSQPAIIIHPIHGGSDPLGLQRTLWEVNPRYVILYDSNMQFVRQLEVYHATQPDIPLRVYFLTYKNSVEEQRYLTTLRKEKEAFEYLIKEKATMVIPEERDGKLEDDPNLHPMPLQETSMSSRRGGLEKPKEQQMIIVDMREFRSELPSLIHKRGIHIEPVTIEVGDYILTPDICVERKSVSDLIGSLNNGRLYNQCVSMSRYYKKPILLIEFDPNKSFALMGKYKLSSEVSMNDVTSRLTLLTIHFPTLRILWCQSPYATAELFEELKMGREQPNVSSALSVTATEENIEWNERYNPGPQDFLLKMPGINSKNYRLIMNMVTDLHELSSLSLEQLTEILGNARNAETLWNFISTKDKVLSQKETAGKSKTDLKKSFKRR
ncbi:ERCC4 [Acanthosepion pharaonis]|uniref:DNA repair endonuclease XPF n=1 Tax=Acanthosepion pharaonis TaxID=158019 RepID=A0A812BYW8_ACAPH|nr:ERCC4 [Sepia pharaonis]